ncbi:MAG: peptidase, partial [Sphingobacteriales bacterium]
MGQVEALSSAQVGLVLAAFNATLTRANGVYEKDLALHLNLIANTADVIFYDPATDPYTTLNAWNGQLQNTLTNVIGAANYDIGHMFGASGGGGNAGCIGCVCGALKGSGITSPADGIPQGDNFDIDYVVHEVGHQLGANHTFSMNTEGSGVNKEVASGITIMGYAGIVAGLNAAAHSIDIFHQTSIEQIQNNLATKTCPVTTNITANNATPVVAPVPNFTIPISTPFALTGSATDANAADVLTYCWEQNDNASGGGSTGNNSVASPTKTVGPNFLSFVPTVSPTRTFPRLQSILNGAVTSSGTLFSGNNINIEALSSVGRTLNFRLTVRDNSPYSSTAPIKVGQTAYTDMQVIVTNTSGPFAVTVPNTNVTWPGSSSQTVTWSVNNTTAAPVSCASVRILLSTDGGLTFPTVLA